MPSPALQPSPPQLCWRSAVGRYVLVAPFQDRSVHHDELTVEQACELEAFARKPAVLALREVNCKALALVEATKIPEDQPLHRVNFGVFVFAERDASTHNQPSHADGAAE